MYVFCRSLILPTRSFSVLSRLVSENPPRHFPSQFNNPIVIIAKNNTTPALLPSPPTFQPALSWLELPIELCALFRRPGTKYKAAPLLVCSPSISGSNNVRSCTMAPSFLKDIRRRSKASFRTDKSTDSSTGGSNGTNGSVPTTKSSSTLNSTYGSTTPPALTDSISASNLQALIGPPTIPNNRPTISASSSNRYSVSGMSGLGSPSQSKSSLPTSQYAPRILSIADSAWVAS